MTKRGADLFSLVSLLGVPALALLVVMALGYVPFVGPIILMIITLMGVGACILTVSGRGQPV